MKKKFLRLKEKYTKDLAMMALSVLCIFYRICCKFSKSDRNELLIYKIKTKKYHTKIMFDMYRADLLFFKRKGFFKQWECLDKREMPASLSKNIFDFYCDKKERARLVNKVMTLKAFW